MEDLQEAAAAQATPLEAQQEAQTNDMEEERAPHMQWTYKVLTSSARANSRLLFYASSMRSQTELDQFKR